MLARGATGLRLCRSAAALRNGCASRGPQVPESQRLREVRRADLRFAREVGDGPRNTQGAVIRPSREEPPVERPGTPREPATSSRPHHRDRGQRLGLHPPRPHHGSRGRRAPARSGARGCSPGSQAHPCGGFAVQRPHPRGGRTALIGANCHGISRVCEEALRTGPAGRTLGRARDSALAGRASQRALHGLTAARGSAVKRVTRPGGLSAWTTRRSRGPRPWCGRP